MPKRKIVVKTERGIKLFKAQTKFRIGNRKSGRSALTMTTAELLNELESTNNKRSHDNVRTVLHKRGVKLPQAA